jgi:RNA polymerase sigma factor (sigma-70 family)
VKRDFDHLRHTLAAQALAGLPDPDLLRTFVQGGSNAGPAFEAILRRHGPMVWRACRAAVRDPGSAEDAFQATFLVLVRRAGGMGGVHALGPWLFGVCRRVCRRARSYATRRREHEALAGLERALRAVPDDRDAREVIAAVHDEVARLPAGLRAAVVSCDLEGLSYEEAARRLGWTSSTLRGRLARARERLRWRLARRGLGPLMTLPTVPVPRALVRATVWALAAGPETGVVSESVAVLTGGIYPMFTKLKAAGLSAVTVGVLIAGAISISGQVLRPPQPETTPAGNPTPLGEFVTPDVAERIAQLARQAKKLQADGNSRAGVAALQQAEDLVRAWKGELAKEADRRARNDQAKAMDDGQPKAKLALDAYRRALNVGSGAGDLEARVKALEEKLDRILKVLDSPRGRPGIPGGATDPVKPEAR